MRVGASPTLGAVGGSVFEPSYGLPEVATPGRSGAWFTEAKFTSGNTLIPSERRTVTWSLDASGASTAWFCSRSVAVSPVTSRKVSETSDCIELALSGDLTGRYKGAIENVDNNVSVSFAGSVTTVSAAR